ncbi:MAG TPA: aminotransferase class I/II-fold pyridoxal phosphate-dependent enzyme [Polyangiales bacterium]|nr:aminotransferase class I/II-fold pyridoxal phosphate-dependent enzyme [Polyangiales bacterium]
MAEQTVNPLAQALNDRMEKAAPEAFAMLSALGRRLYFPKGILSQGAEAKQKAKRINATIGIATEGGKAMHLASIQEHVHDVSPDDAYTYAAPAGRQGLRELWRTKLMRENPSLAGKVIGLPIVTSAITHGLALAGDLFIDPGDTIVMPDQLWGNYRLAYEVRLGGQVKTFPFFAGSGFNQAGFAAALDTMDGQGGKLIVLLNFPNNPTGYMPTEGEGDAIVAILEATAKAGKKLVVLCDDAYFGLFYHIGGRSMTESLFGRIANLHPNLLAVKLDGATKELFVWGLRCGFITFAFGSKDGSPDALAVLDEKTRGDIRAVVSNSPQLSQSLVEKALASKGIDAERAQKHALLQARAQEVDRVAREARFASSWDVYPFNSGYFMLIKVKGVSAHKLREHLLDQHQVGLISTAESDLRVAFSCLEIDQVTPLFETVHQAIGELRGSQ